MDRLGEESVDDPVDHQQTPASALQQQPQQPMSLQQPAPSLQPASLSNQQQQVMQQPQHQQPAVLQPASLSMQQQSYIQQQQPAPSLQPASLSNQQQQVMQQPQHQQPAVLQPASLSMQQQSYIQQQQPAPSLQPASLSNQQQLMQQPQHQQPAVLQPASLSLHQQPYIPQQQLAPLQPASSSNQQPQFMQQQQLQHQQPAPFQQAQWQPFTIQQQQQPQWQQPSWMNQQSSVPLSSPPQPSAGAWSPVMQFCSPASNASQAYGSATPENPSFFNRPGNRYNLRSQMAPRVTLPWEKRLGRGRPNMTETALKNLYDLGLIEPGPSAGQPGQQAPLFLQQAAGAGLPQAAHSAAQQQVYLPAQSSMSMGYQPLNAPQPMMLPATTSTAAAAAPPGHQADGDKSCVVCRGDPNGLLVCGHHICKVCFDQQMVVKPECPNPRCPQILTQSSFILFKRT